jgi:hypothetical protein
MRLCNSAFIFCSELRAQDRVSSEFELNMKFNYDLKGSDDGV